MWETTTIETKPDWFKIEKNNNNRPSDILIPLSKIEFITIEDNKIILGMDSGKELTIPADDDLIDELNDVLGFE